MKKVIICILLLCVKSSFVLAQDPSFSQPYANPLYINPAFAGTGTSQRIGINFRDEWPNIPGTFVTYNASYDRNIIDSSTGIGVLINEDRAGQATLITNNASLILSRQFHVKTFTLSVGIQGTYYEKSVDWSKLTFGDQIDATRGFIYNSNELSTNNRVVVADFSAGILGYTKRYFIGFSMDHLTQPDESFVTGSSPLPIKYAFNAGGMIEIGSFVVSPTILYQKQQDFNQFVFECYLIKGHFTMGVGCRLGDALIGVIGYQNKFMRIGYSYDYTISALTIQTGGSHEASFAFLLPYHSGRLKKVNGINCPAF
jgi:type IX secretion system PorP/SprF family membrane protein